MTTRGGPHIAVIDIGKTNAKLVLVDSGEPTELGTRTRPNTVLTGDPYPRYDIEALWQFILDALAALHREHGVDRIIATTHGAAAALLDAQGDLALPVLDYEHGGPESVAADYDAIRPSFAETGSPRLPAGLNLGAQIFWQSRHFPKAFRDVASIVMYPQYWGFRLTGVTANEVTSLGAHSDLWNPQTRDYSAIVDRLGWRPLFASIRKAADRLGTIRPEIAEQTGLRQDTPVYCGLHDSNAALLPHLLSRRPPFSVVSTGTWVIAMAVGGAPVVLDPLRDTLLNVNALGDPVASARFMGGREYAVLTAGLNGVPSAEESAAVLSRLTMLLPSVQSGSGPFPNRKAVWRRDTGISPGERHAAISFYLGMMTSVCLEAIGAEGITITEGPFARNDLYSRMLSAATGRSVLPTVTEGLGPSMGAALVASNAAWSAPPEEAIIFEDDEQWRSYARAWRAETHLQAV